MQAFGRFDDSSLGRFRLARLLHHIFVKRCRRCSCVAMVHSLPDIHIHSGIPGHTKKSTSMQEILEQGKNNVKKLSMGIRMVVKGSHKEVIMGSYADWQIFMLLMKKWSNLFTACRSTDGLSVDRPVCVRSRTGRATPSAACPLQCFVSHNFIQSLGQPDFNN